MNHDFTRRLLWEPFRRAATKRELSGRDYLLFLPGAGLTALVVTLGLMTVDRSLRSLADVSLSILFFSVIVYAFVYIVFARMVLLELVGLEDRDFVSLEGVWANLRRPFARLFVIYSLLLAATLVCAWSLGLLNLNRIGRQLPRFAAFPIGIILFAYSCKWFLSRMR